MMEENTTARYRSLIMNIEKSLPILIGCCAIITVILLPLSISNSHMIHSPETRRILSGEDGLDKAKHDIEHLNKLKDRIKTMLGKKEPGSDGTKGTTGDNGSRGERGDKGMPGTQGDRGRMGRNGTSGSDGAKGQKGEPGQKGAKGEGTGTPGPKGQKGEKGEKGAGAYVQPGPKEFSLGSNRKGDARVFQVFCSGLCRHVTLQLRARGDADLYGKEGSPPSISGSDCSECSLCRSREGDDRTDACTVSTTRMDNFYAVVYAHKSYRNGKLTIDGPNFIRATVDREDSVIQSEGDA